MLHVFHGGTVQVLSELQLMSVMKVQENYKVSNLKTCVFLLSVYRAIEK